MFQIYNRIVKILVVVLSINLSCVEGSGTSWILSLLSPRNVLIVPLSGSRCGIQILDIHQYKHVKFKYILYFRSCCVSWIVKTIYWLGPQSKEETVYVKQVSGSGGVLSISNRTRERLRLHHGSHPEWYQGVLSRYRDFWAWATGLLTSWDN